MPGGCRWSTAIELAEQHGFPQIEGLLTRYANALQSKGRYLEAVELFRIANKPHEAAMLVQFECANDATRFVWLICCGECLFPG
jgi:hypothetical protein